MEFLLYLVLGCFAGLAAGLFGIGGGLIIVPVLVYSLAAQGVDPAVLTHMAVGTSLATIIFTSLNAIRTHHRKGAVRWSIVLWMSLGILVGAALGGVTAGALKGPLLQKIIGVFAILMAIQLGLNLQPRSRREVPGQAGLGLAGTLIGWASAIFGIGGGSLTVPFLVWRSVPMQQAVATAAACGLPTAVSGAISFVWVGWHHADLPPWSLGFVYLPALSGIVATSMYFAGLGARLAHRLSPLVLKRLFALLLLGVGTNFLI